jgi:hypothetical protein
MDRREFTGSIASFFASAVGLSLFSSQLSARQYLTVEQAQKILFGGEVLTKTRVKLTAIQKKAIREASGIRVQRSYLFAWKASSGGWFLLDQVIGKHEYIDLAIALSNTGSVKGIEILNYRESYGGDVRHKRWRAQFAGFKYDKKIRIDREVMSITGATLSCRHIVEGMNRILHTWDVALRHI